MRIVVDALGWLGAGCLLVAFALLARGRVAAASRPYMALNLLGSAGLAVAGVTAGAWPSTALNIVWVAIGLSSVLRPAARPDRVHESRAGTY